jgi:hypothetical protein
MIFDLLTPAALAQGILCDGVCRNPGIALCTVSFTVEEVVRLMNVLLVRYQLDCTLFFHGKNNTQPRIYIRSKSMPLLRSIVLPHMHNSMLYKIGL